MRVALRLASATITKAAIFKLTQHHVPGISSIVSIAATTNATACSSFDRRLMPRQVDETWPKAKGKS